MATNGGPNIIEDGLVFAVDAANKKSYPGSGTTWIDLAGSNNGTLTNGPTFDSGNGGSFDFDGSNDEAQTSSTLGLGGNSSKTFCLFVKLGSFAAMGEKSIFEYGVTSTAAHFALETRNSSQIQFNGWFRDVVVNYSDYGQWSYLTVTHDESSNTTSVFNNGTLLGRDTSNSLNTTDTVLKIADGRRGNSLMDLSVFQVYNRALSSSEILQNYNALKGRFGL